MTEERRRHEDRLLGETIVRLEAHETADSLMFKQINTHMAAIETSIGKLFNRFWVAAIGVILTLMAVSSYLYVESAKINKEFMRDLAQMVQATKKGVE